MVHKILHEVLRKVMRKYEIAPERSEHGFARKGRVHDFAREQTRAAAAPSPVAVPPPVSLAPAPAPRASAPGCRGSLRTKRRVNTYKRI
eukprot:2638294-Pleurochrysis_carterae.AAC.2